MDAGVGEPMQLEAQAATDSDSGILSARDWRLSKCTEASFSAATDAWMFDESGSFQRYERLPAGSVPLGRIRDRKGTVLHAFQSEQDYFSFE